MKTVLTILLIVCCLNNVAAQRKSGYDYKNAAGVKFYPAALTIKHFFNRHIAVEGISYFYGNNAVRFTALAEFHFDIEKVEGLKWFIGPGAHVSFVRYNKQGNVFVGIDGILGLDYKFKDLPINLSVDWQPSFEFGEDPIYVNGQPFIKDGPGFTGSWAGVAARFTF